jgi:hypothetical protein
MCSVTVIFATENTCLFHLLAFNVAIWFALSVQKRLNLLVQSVYVGRLFQVTLTPLMTLNHPSQVPMMSLFRLTLVWLTYKKKKWKFQTPCSSCYPRLLRNPRGRFWRLWWRNFQFLASQRAATSLLLCKCQPHNKLLLMLFVTLETSIILNAQKMLLMTSLDRFDSPDVLL